MFVYPVTSGECIEAHPTYVRLAPCARNMIAPFSPFNRYAAPGAVLHVVILHPLLQQLIIFVSLGARCAFVVLNVAKRADALQAGWTLQDGSLGGGPIDLLAIGSGTVVEFLGPGMDVGEIRRPDERVEVVGFKAIPSDAQGNGVRALPLVAKAAQREGTPIDSSLEIVAEAFATPGMSAAKSNREGHGVQTGGAGGDIVRPV